MAQLATAAQAAQANAPPTQPILESGARAFEAVTARAKVAKAHQGGGVLDGMLNIGTGVSLGIVDGGADVVSDGGRHPPR